MGENGQKRHFFPHIGVAKNIFGRIAKQNCQKITRGHQNESIAINRHLMYNYDMNVLTTKQIAEQFSVQVQTVSRWCQKGKFPDAFKVGRDWIVPQDNVAGFDPPNPGRPPTNGNNSQV